ncbi:MAG: Ig-like domain-containing protein, partial [Bacteroidota bacterium]
MNRLSILLLLYIAFFVYSCASEQPPPGGPKDEKEPELISTIPINGSKNYKGRTIQFVFDEAVQLNNIYKQLLITPITEDLKYESRVKKNRVIINFEEDFLENTTYTINLRDAVVDITEKNIAKNVKIAFSTGNFIDSLSIKGTVNDLFTGLPPKDAVVMLFRPEDTLNVQDPYYLTKIEEDGSYLLENIKVADYQIFALEEEDNNYRYTKDEEEKIGFLTENIKLDSSITNLHFKVASYDNAELIFKRATSRNQYVELSFSKPLKNIELLFSDDSFQDSIYYAIEEDIVRLYNTKVPKT